MARNAVLFGGERKVEMMKLNASVEADRTFTFELWSRVVNGDGIEEIARDVGVRVDVLRKWIREDEVRNMEYAEAREMRDELRAERLKDRTAAGAFATVQDALTASGEWLDVNLWPSGLLAACDQVEFSPEGKPYKIKMNTTGHADRLARMLGLDQTGKTEVNIQGLVGVLSGMPAGAPRVRPGEKVAQVGTEPTEEITRSVAPPDAPWSSA